MLMLIYVDLGLLFIAIAYSKCVVDTIFNKNVIFTFINFLFLLLFLQF